MGLRIGYIKLACQLRVCPCQNYLFIIWYFRPVLPEMKCIYKTAITAANTGVFHLFVEEYFLRRRIDLQNIGVKIIILGGEGGLVQGTDRGHA
jgi:hypothetical protein